MNEGPIHEYCQYGSTFAYYKVYTKHIFMGQVVCVSMREYIHDHQHGSSSVCAYDKVYTVWYLVS